MGTVSCLIFLKIRNHHIKIGLMPVDTIYPVSFVSRSELKLPTTPEKAVTPQSRPTRLTLASTILVSGGTAMLPGFIPRLHSEILKALSPPPVAPSASRQNSPHKSSKPPPPQYDKYAALRPLTPYFAIVNNPTPPAAPSERARANAGKAPAFGPGMLAWVGGSLSGYVSPLQLF